MNYMKKLLIVLVCMSFKTTMFSQVNNVSKTIQKIESYLTSMEEVGFSGTVLIELKGEKVLSKGYGLSDKEHSMKNEPKTIFDIGSLTKQFTASAILKLEMQGKLSTDDNISKYFDSVPKDKSTITIHDLLRHQSGLPSGVGNDYDSINEADFLERVMKAPLRFKTGTNFSYSNIGYSLLAIVIEKTSGKTYENHLYENLWNPAQMEFTGYSRPDFDTTKVAVGYYRDDRVWGKPTDKNWDTDAPYWHLKGNGGILSTTEDLYKWHKALMTEQVLSKEAKQKLYHPKIRANETYNAIYAYGWDVSKTDRNTYRVWHNGTNNILYADFMRFIDEDVTLIMFSNKSHPDFDKLNQELSKIIFDKTYKPTIPIAENETNKFFTQNIIETILENGLKTAKKEYKERNKNTDLIESILNTKGYRLISENKVVLAISVFEMNVFAFPKSANAFDSLAEAYMVNGNKQFAIEYYEKSLKLNPSNGNAIDMLKKLKNQ